MDIEQTKKAYEVGFIARNEAGAQAVSRALKAAGAEISFEGPVSRVALAYDIEKETQADFGYVQFQLEPAKILDLDQTLKTEKSLLRFLIMTSDFLKQKATKDVAPTRTRIVKAPLEPKFHEPLSNEALEKKIEEILK